MRKVILTLFFISGVIFAQGTQQDSIEVLKNWSLFYEYFKTGDYVSAFPYGWKVMEMQPTRFKTLYKAMEKIYLKFYEEAPPEKKTQYADTLLIIYDNAIKYHPENASEYYLRKGYVLENYYTNREIEAIQAYEKGIELDFEHIEFYYIDRLGVLYIKHMEENPEYREKAIELYRKVLDKDPQNVTANDRLRALVKDISELIELNKKRLEVDPENTELIWTIANLYIRAEDYRNAIPYLEKLTKKFPDNETYWNRLGYCYQRVGEYKKAIDVYNRSLKINPDAKEIILNIAVCYRELDNFEQARIWARRAMAKDKNWGRPYLEIAQIYEAAVAKCVKTTKGGDWTKIDFVDKLVYQLAVEYYELAKRIDPSVANEANQRIKNLETLVPTQEDYFFNKRKIKEGKIAITGGCYDWIGESITVPYRI
ncbi:tetratricopeptide repeat protein [Candidatus Kryptobacter tengchongensis]|uniref:Tetratricopeptide repeat-containing protein n=1 Tax=Kryptobacter tengchongensis TaxID=1643429 RepID=A0A916PIE8_KRYT1|nr:tetratricopeptide repeat protein [Candidatus Kryptobacter tengchongensis]CUS83016.1 Tetratricopeptide repeat-containing protein [Candidatus Kryptobacter tengchongensis]CUT03866.1 Tetratricopeptide repeat-containing protein [Candidatus Kryptobacter tengchongensis]